MVRRAAAIVLLSACAHAPASRWEDYKSGVYTVCICEGKERNPTPSEAESFPEGQRIDSLCEGKVRDCHKPSGDQDLPYPFN